MLATEMARHKDVVAAAAQRGVAAENGGLAACSDETRRIVAQVPRCCVAASTGELSFCLRAHVEGANIHTHSRRLITWGDKLTAPASGSTVAHCYGRALEQAVSGAQALLHMADVSAPARPARLAGMWAAAVCEEFFSQADRERTLELEMPAPSPRRDESNISKSQVRAALLACNLGNLMMRVLLRGGVAQGLCGSRPTTASREATLCSMQGAGRPHSAR